MPMNSIIENDISIDSEYFIQTHITNPLLKHSTLDHAIDFYENKELAIALFQNEHRNGFYDHLQRP